MNKRTFWILAVVICLGFAIWGLGFGLGGCSSTLTEVAGSTSTSTSTTTSMSTATTLALTWSGTKQFGGGGSGVDALLSDAEGNIYAVGVVGISLEGNTYQGVGGDVYLMKYDPAGNRKWTGQIGSSGDDTPRSAARDSDGNIYIAGHTDSGLDGNTNAGMLDIFLLKYDSSGNKQWLKQFGTGSDDTEPRVTVDSHGNIFLAGSTSAGIDGNEPIGSVDFFLTKFNASGDKQWTKQFGTSAWDNVLVVKTDSAGNIYLTGWTLLGELYGNTNIGQADAFLMKCDPEGKILWTKQFGSTATDSGNGLAIDAAGDIYVGGDTYGDLDGTGNSGSQDIYLAKYDSSGDQQWLKQFGTGNQDFCDEITIDSAGHVYLVGDTKGGFPGYDEAGFTTSDIFLLKTSAGGDQLWVRQFGTAHEDHGDCVVTDPSDNIFVGGNTVTGFDGNPDHQGAFVAKFDSSGNRK